MHRSLRLALALLALALASPPARAEPKPPKGAIPVERYPASFRLKVAEAIERGKMRLIRLQAPQGHWGGPDDIHAMGHTSLPVLALLKGGMSSDAEPIQRAFAWVRKKPFTSTYGVGCYMMAIHAKYAPHVGTLDTDVDRPTSGAPSPDEIRERLSPEDLDALEKGLDYLTRSQAVHGLWRYHVQEGPDPRDHDLSCTQYALLGLRAIEACGVDVPLGMWRLAFTGLPGLQARGGPQVDLLDYRLKDGYAFQRMHKARARGFRYRMDVKDGPLGKGTVPTLPETGSMTTAGVASTLICREGLWRHRRLRGKQRRQAEEAVRDGLAWLQEHYSVTENPGKEQVHLYYYLYGLERAMMLAGRRWIGDHDWYLDGATHLLSLEKEHEAWGRHEPTSFAILFLKRATARPADVPVITGK